MKIVILADSISTQRAGIHYYGRQLIKQLTERYPQHEYIAISSEKQSFIPFEQIVVPIKSAIPQHLRLRQLFTIPRIVNKLNPDIAIELAHFGPFKLKKSIQRITVIHDLTPITHPMFHGKMSNLMHRRFLPDIFKNADHIIANSNSTRDEINRLYDYPTERIHVVYPILHKTYTDNQVDELETIITENTKYFLSVGTVEPRKDYLTLIRAFDKIADLDPNLNLVIAGQSGWKNNAFFSTLNALEHKNRIHITGYINRRTLQSLYENAEVFVNCSIAEGFGLPVLEAMHFGLPLILSDIPTSREVASEAGLFFPVGDVSSLAKLLKMWKTDDSTLQQRKKVSLNRYEVFSTPTWDLTFLKG